MIPTIALVLIGKARWSGLFAICQLSGLKIDVRHTEGSRAGLVVLGGTT